MAKSIQDLNLRLEDLATTSATTTDQSSFTSRFFSSLFTRLTRWFADTTNGITDFFAKIGHFDKVCVKNSDGTETCVDGDQLKSLLGAAAAGASALGAVVDEAPTDASASLGESTDTAANATPGSDEEDPAEDDSAADAPSSGVAQEVPAASPTSEGTNADTEIHTTTEVDGPGADNAPAANDNHPPEQHAATGTE